MRRVTIGRMVGGSHAKVRSARGVVVIAVVLGLVL
jgi:hypothetical protein